MCRILVAQKQLYGGAFKKDFMKIVKNPHEICSRKFPVIKNGVNEVSIIELKKYKYIYKSQWIDGTLFEDF